MYPPTWQAVHFISLTTAPDDFFTSVVAPRFSPDPANNNPCIQINLENDQLVEEDEYFLVELDAGNEAIDIPDDSSAQVTITDDDGEVESWLLGKLAVVGQETPVYDCNDLDL